jgi:hypothetical protein
VPAVLLTVPLAAALSGPGAAAATPPSPPDAPSASTPAHAAGTDAAQAWRLERRRAFAARVAASLGGSITARQVMDAFEAVRAQHPATPDAWITAMAARLHVTPAALSAAVGSAHAADRVGRHGMHMRLFRAAADYLGMDPAQLRDALAKGQTLAQVAKDSGKSVDGLEAAIAAQARAEIHRMVHMPWRPVRKAPQGPAA